MTDLFVFRSLIAACALAAVSAVEAQSKPKASAVLLPTAVKQGQEGERVRARLAKAIELLQDEDASKSSQKKALAMLKAAMSSLKKGDYEKAKVIYSTAKKAAPEDARKWAAIALGAAEDAKKDALIARLKTVDESRSEYAEAVKLMNEEKLVFAEKAKQAGDLKKAAAALRDFSVSYTIDEQDPQRVRYVTKKNLEKAKKAKGEYVFYVEGDKVTKKAKADFNVFYRDEQDSKAKRKGVYFGTTDKDGRFAIVRQAKNLAEAKANEKVRGLLGRVVEDAEDESNDGDIVEAINGVRAELRAIRKLMERAHHELDDDSDGEDVLFQWRQAPKDTDLSAPKATRYRFNRTRDLTETEGEADEPHGVWVELNTEAKQKGEGVWLEVAPTIRKAKKGVEAKKDTKVRWRTDGDVWFELEPTKAKSKQKAPKDTGKKARVQWNSAIGIGGGAGGKFGGPPIAVDVVVDETAPEPFAVQALDTGAYTIEVGDTLARIAKKKLGSKKRIHEIRLLNPELEAGKLHVGRKIRLPKAKTKTSWRYLR